MIYMREDDAAIERAVGEIATAIFHPTGTCAMGRHDRAAIISGNTHAPSVMIGEKGAAMILAAARRQVSAGLPPARA